MRKRFRCIIDMTVVYVKPPDGLWTRYPGHLYLVNYKVRVQVVLVQRYRPTQYSTWRTRTQVINTILVQPRCQLCTHNTYLARRCTPRELFSHAGCATDRAVLNEAAACGDRFVAIAGRAILPIRQWVARGAYPACEYVINQG